MRFYTISDEYIAFLQQFDKKVPNSGGTNYKNKKVYIGVVLEIGTHKFLAPLTSHKEAHDRIQSSSCSAFKLHERTNPDNKLGLISINYMVPVPDSELIELDIDTQEYRYKRMLYMQYEFIKINREEIVNRAAKLYEHVVIKRSAFFVKISCDIPKLVDEYKNFKKAE